ncbi:MAG: hypothetical protein ABIB11_01010 [Candidatus Omnitrophota bacterium]
MFCVRNQLDMLGRSQLLLANRTGSAYSFSRPGGRSYYRVLFFFFLLVFLSSPAYALDLPKGARDYYKDSRCAAPGFSEGVGPTAKPKTQKGVDVGRRQTQEFDFSDEDPLTLSMKAWESLNKKDEPSMLAYTLRCIELYEKEAVSQQASLVDFAPSGSESTYGALNSVGASYFIQGEFYKSNKQWQKAIEAYNKVIDEFSFSQYWDPRGWWWKPSEIASGEIKKIQEGYYEQE